MGKVTPPHGLTQLHGVAAEAGFGGIPIAAAVERLAGVGLPPGQIARVLGVTEATVRSKHADAMALGKAKANLQVANAMFETATDRNHPKHATMAIFWAKANMGWRDSEIGGRDDGDESATMRSQADRMRPQLGDGETARRFADLMQRLNAEAASQTTPGLAAGGARSGPKIT